MKMKTLDMGCRKNKYPGAVGIDIDPNSDADIIQDLDTFPYPFKDNEFDVIRARYILEHLSNRKKVIEEIHRIGKPNAKVIIWTNHRSGTANYDNIDHKSHFTCGTFMHLRNYGFKVNKIQLNYFVRGYKQSFLRTLIFNPVDRIISFFANFLGWISIRFCERVWCYWVGGFDEIYCELEVMKAKKEKT